LHHLIEKGKLSEALARFEQALALRQQKGDQLFINLTQRTIDKV